MSTSLTSIGRQVSRLCPICDSTSAETLHRQTFASFDGIPVPNEYDVVCCARCGFVYADFPVSASEVDAYYVERSKYQDPRTSTGAGESTWDRARLAQTAADLARFLPSPEVRILDIGCANGGLLMALRGLGFHNLTGIDPSPVCVQNARARKLEALAGTLTNPPNAIGQFDCVILSHVLEHVAGVGPAIASLRRFCADGGLVYAEVPDATRYAEHVYAPFQDFNTEHINHFSSTHLERAFTTEGFRTLAESGKTLQTGPHTTYPALWTVFQACVGEVQPIAIQRDIRLKERIEEYIDISAAQMSEIDSRIRRLLEHEPDVIIWGTGQLALKLLRESSLRKARVVACVDGNPVNHGRKLNGVPVVSGDYVRGTRYPIVITSTLHEEAIAADILRLGLPNEVVFLSGRNGYGAQTREAEA